MSDPPMPDVLCGPCYDEICEQLGCSIPGWCTCEKCRHLTHPDPEDERSMTTRHNLPSGGWVELRDVSELKAKDRKRVMRGLKDPEDGHMIAMSVDMADGIIATMVTAWELPYLPDAPIPSVQLDVLDELEMPDENVLQKLTEPAAKLFQPGGVDPSEYDNPDSPTVPASA